MIENPIVFGGFLLGLFGSIHCVGMCGPIALSLPGNEGNKVSLIAGRLLYNFGRILTYMFLGLLIGFLGEGFSFAGLQQIVSILAGVVLLFFAMMPSGYLNKWMHHSPLVFNKYFGNFFRSRMKKNSYSSLLSIGLINGFLPCGFVYLGLIGAVGMNSIGQSMLFMCLFGLGTVPVMLAMSLITSAINAKSKHRLQKIFPYMTAFVAILLILRGLELGIPFISPVLSGQINGPPEMCH
jgi:sulfite exporter TauE/SafE